MKHCWPLIFAVSVLLSACQKSDQRGEGDSPGGPGSFEPGPLSESQIQNFLRGTALLTRDQLAMRFWSKTVLANVTDEKDAKKYLDPILKLDFQNGLYSLRRK